MKYLLALLAALAFVTPSYAQRFEHSPEAVVQDVTEISCRNVVDVASLGNVLYKNENVHGGRGRTFLDQGHRFGGARTLYVAGTNRKVYACFGLWACDQPFGCRYYQAMCHDTVSNSDFSRLARRNGGTNYALVGTGRGTCYKILTTASRYGSVVK